MSLYTVLSRILYYCCISDWIQLDARDQYNPSRSSRHKSPAQYRSGSCATYSAQLEYRGNLSGWATAGEDEGVAEAASEDSKDDEETEDVPQILQDVIAGLEELNKEMRSILSPTPGNTSSLKSTVVPNVDVWDTKKALEQEYRLHPDPSIDEISSRLFN